MTRDPINHGTYAGYQKHNRLGTPPCDDCRDANAAYARQYRGETARRSARRNAYARQHVLTQVRLLAPDLYRRLYREAAMQWDDAHPQPEETP